MELNQKDLFELDIKMKEEFEKMERKKNEL